MTNFAVFGSTGYVGSAIVKELLARGIEVHRGERGSFSSMENQIRYSDAIINAAVFIRNGKASDCEGHEHETIMGNAILPTTLSNVAESAGIPIIHISTGCLFNDNVEHGEKDAPQRGFGGHCGTYVGSKLLAEQAVLENLKSYVLRIRLPFDEFSSPRNYINKIASFPEVYDHVNSLTHRGDFVKVMLDLWDKAAPYGIYNVVNDGQISAREVAANMLARGIIKKEPNFVTHESAGCLLSTKKLLDAGVKIRPVGEAVDDALKNWVE